MSLVSHDSTWECHNGVTNEQKDDTIEKKKAKDRVSEREAFKETESNNTIDKTLNTNIYDNVTQRNENKRKDVSVKDNGINIENTSAKHNIEEEKSNSNPYKNIDVKLRSYKNAGSETCEKNFTNKKWNRTNDCETRALYNLLIDYKNADEYTKVHLDKQIFKNNIAKTSTPKSHTRNKIKSHVQKKMWQKQSKHKVWAKSCASNALRRLNERYIRKPRWRIDSGVLISFVVLNLVGLSSASDTSSFSSALTSRMIASFLGYPSTCSLGAEVRPCTLTLSCWLRGGTRLTGCGGWLFSCCGLPEPSRETFDNSIPSSEWKYKPPSTLRHVPQRSVLPNNVFRRRVDDDVAQTECGVPSSRLLQKRIIGGREARFAEFPWQAHVRISEFQCGGVLVSRRYVATAAHCVSRAHTRDIAVWLGAIDTSATHHPARKLGVIQKILHPLFQFRMTQPDRYDIALLKLSRVITYMSHILPICLPEHDLELRGRSGVIAGWGKTDASNGHTGTNLLRSATVPILSKEQCIIWHQSKQISVEIHSEMICAGHPDGHQDACLGDSGGPLIVLDNGRYYLVGITSAGFGCGVDHQPGIYHNVKLTANWIRSVITPTPTVNYNDNYIN